jgi:hypothetical protein
MSWRSKAGISDRFKLVSGDGSLIKSLSLVKEVPTSDSEEPLSHGRGSIRAARVSKRFSIPPTHSPSIVTQGDRGVDARGAAHGDVTRAGGSGE